MLLLVAHHIAAAAAVVAADGKGTQHMVHQTAAAAAAVGTVADSWDRAVAAVVAAGSGDGPTDPTGAVRTDRCTVAVAADGGGGGGGGGGEDDEGSWAAAHSQPVPGVGEAGPAPAPDRRETEWVAAGTKSAEQTAVVAADAAVLQAGCQAVGTCRRVAVAWCCLPLVGWKCRKAWRLH